MEYSTIFYIVFISFSLKPTSISSFLTCSLYGILTSLLHIHIASYCILSSSIVITQISEPIYKHKDNHAIYKSHMKHNSVSSIKYRVDLFVVIYLPECHLCPLSACFTSRGQKSDYFFVNWKDELTWLQFTTNGSVSLVTLTYEKL